MLHISIHPGYEDEQAKDDDQQEEIVCGVSLARLLHHKTDFRVLSFEYVCFSFFSQDGTAFLPWLLYTSLAKS
jgi:hypothetical protein